MWPGIVAEEALEALELMETEEAEAREVDKVRNYLARRYYSSCHSRHTDRRGNRHCSRNRNQRRSD